MSLLCRARNFAVNRLTMVSGLCCRGISSLRRAFRLSLRTASACSSTGSGIFNRKRDPLPTVLETSTLPPWTLRHDASRSDVPQSRAAHLARAGAIDSIEAFEDPIQVGLGNADAIVLHFNCDGFVIASDGYAHHAGLRRIFDGVIDQIAQSAGSRVIRVCPDTRTRQCGFDISTLTDLVFLLCRRHRQIDHAPRKGSGIDAHPPRHFGRTFNPR